VPEQEIIIMKRELAMVALVLVLSGAAVKAQEIVASDKDSIMITIFLRHQQDKNLDSLQAIQARNKFSSMFPPKSARVVSWYVMMGIGQVVTVKIPASELRNLNLSIEHGAWGAFKTESMFFGTGILTAWLKELFGGPFRAEKWRPRELFCP